MNSNHDNREMTPGEQLAAENDLLKLKLQAEFGLSNMDPKLDKQAENEWLNYIYDFEKQFAEGKRTRVYDLLGCPKYRKANELTRDEFVHELEALKNVMQKSGMLLNTLSGYDHELIYRFITEELFEHQTEAVQVPGLTINFVYEDFHPNHDFDIRRSADAFIEGMISKKWDDFYNTLLLCSTVNYNGNEYDYKSFQPIIEAFQLALQNMDLLRWEIHNVAFDLEKETGALKGSIEYKSVSRAQSFHGEVELEFKWEYEYWSVSKVVLPGFSK